MDLVEELPNCLRRALTTARERGERFCKVRVQRGTQPPYIYRLKPETRTCPVKTASAVQKLQKLPKKLIFNGFWHRTNRIYICVAHGQVLKKKTYIYGLKSLES
jgi:hypothetical protein